MHPVWLERLVYHRYRRSIVGCKVLAPILCLPPPAWPVRRREMGVDELILQKPPERGGLVPGEEGAAPVFWTDSGKIEFYSQKLATHGFDPMPTWHDEEVDDPPQGYYRLLFGRSPVHTFGRTTNNRLLSEVMDENGVWVNRKVAKR